jgi:hypothetical protein
MTSTRNTPVMTHRPIPSFPAQVERRVEPNTQESCMLRLFKRNARTGNEQPEPAMSTAEMRSELEFCVAELADARERLDRENHSPLQLAEARLDLLQIKRRLDAIGARLDGTGNSKQQPVRAEREMASETTSGNSPESPTLASDDLIMLGRIQERAIVMNERGGRQ